MLVVPGSVDVISTNRLEVTLLSNVTDTDHCEHVWDAET